MSQIISNAQQARGRGLLAAFARGVFSAIGWRPDIPAKLPEHCVIIVYPHTSNWDFPLGLLTKWACGLELNYLGKDSLFKGPLGWLFRATGGVPVDRSHPRGMVGSMVQAFATQPRLRLVIAPEGTRKYVPALKTGFYRIALEAKVPLVLATIDYATKRVAVFDTISLTGDESTDVAYIANAFALTRGKHPRNMGELVFDHKRKSHH